MVGGTQKLARASALVLVLALLGLTAVMGQPAAGDGNEAPGAPVRYRSISVGGFHTCAILDNNTLKCWGENGEGALGYGDTADRGDTAGEMGDTLPAVALGTGRTARTISVSTSSCAILDNSALKCWGSNNFGQLGLGNTANRGDNAGEMGNNLPAVALGSGLTATTVSTNGHTCAILNNGSVKCWGLNDWGQLGLGNTANRGDNAGEMGNNLPAIPLGTGRTATAITTGARHTCALLDNGAVKCWGQNMNGQLGLGDFQDRGDEPGELGNALPAVALGTGRTATAISAYSDSTCALLDNGDVKCWGSGMDGQLGYGNTSYLGDQPGEMGDNLPAVALGTGRTATAVSRGNGRACVLLDNATVKCWGWNINGELGLGDTANRGDGPNEMGDDLPAVALGTGHTATTISSGAYGACVLLEDDTLKCWGYNDAGQLGYGDTETRGNVASEMGDNLPVVSLGAGRTVNEVDPPPAPVIRPDALLRLGNGAPAGNGIYNATGAGQTKTTTVPNRGTATFTATFQNDGDTTDTFRVKGQATTNRYTVTYKVGAANVTAAVVAGTYQFASVPAGGTRAMTVRITAKAGTPVNNTISRTVTVTSQTDTTKKDTVKATVRRR